MDMNQYTLEVMVRERLAEMQAEAEGRRRGDMTNLPHPLRNAIGRALIRAGTRLLGTGRGPCGSADSSRARASHSDGSQRVIRPREIELESGKVVAANLIIMGSARDALVIFRLAGRPLAVVAYSGLKAHAFGPGIAFGRAGVGPARTQALGHVVDASARRDAGP